MSKQFFRMQLDYDLIDKQEVVDDVKKLLAANPILQDNYVLEQSKSGFWHVIFPRSMIPSFEECVAIAEQSRCDRDWLALSRQYECFALVTEKGKTVAHQPQKPFVDRKPPADRITQPVILVLTAESWKEHERLRAISQSMTDDPTWQYQETYDLSCYKTKIRVGCRDIHQAKRRIKFLEKSEIRFLWEIITRSVRDSLKVVEAKK